MDLAHRQQRTGTARAIRSTRMRTAMTLVCLAGLESCSNMQVGGSNLESTVIQILGIALLVWLVLVIV